jgi:hypothetical protein
MPRTSILDVTGVGGTSRIARVGRVALVASAAVLLLAGIAAPVTLACTPVAYPTITALPDDAVVIVGTTGEPTEGGRLFYVERVYAGPITTSPIVIAFKEGEPIGDCSYPVSSGTRLVIAPDVDADGTLRADLATLQADPDSEDGRRYVGEAEERYGPGTVPAGQTRPDGLGGGLGTLPLAVLLAAAAAAVTIVLARAGRGQGGRGRSGRSQSRRGQTGRGEIERGKTGR